jgi:hypothetical protein
MKNGLFREFLRDMLSGDDKEEVVIKTFKAKPEWVKKFSMLEDIAYQEAELSSKRKSIRDGLWGQIHEELNIFGGHLRFNDETNEIEQVEDEE